MAIILSSIHCYLHPVGNHNLQGERFSFQCILTVSSYAFISMVSKKLSSDKISEEGLSICGGRTSL